MSNKTDAEIVILVINGDKELYSELMARYQSKLKRYCTYLLSSDSYSDDVVQNTFIKAYINLNSFDPKRTFSSWIYRIAHNETMNLIKKHKKESLGSTGDIKDFEHLSVVEIDLAGKIDRVKAASAVKAQIDQLPIKYREPLQLNVIEELKYREISDVLNIPPNTVATRIKRAKKIVKDNLRKEDLL